MHDNAPVHTARTLKQTLSEKAFETIDQPPYSPDKPECDYF